MRFHLIAASLLSFVVSASAFADQCAVLDRSQALSFLKLVQVGDYLGSLCEPCGETPSELGGPYYEEVLSLEMREWSEPGRYEVFVNGRSTDLAYSYVQTGATDNVGVSVNAAFLVGCPAQGVTTRFFAE